MIKTMLKTLHASHFRPQYSTEVDSMVKIGRKFNNYPHASTFARLHWGVISVLSFKISSGMLSKYNERYFYNSTSHMK